MLMSLKMTRNIVMMRNAVAHIRTIIALRW
jgi:hypothetical protein